jgi:hypothetical protein
MNRDARPLPVLRLVQLVPSPAIVPIWRDVGTGPERELSNRAQYECLTNNLFSLEEREQCSKIKW